jgi:hypothetical protein
MQHGETRVRSSFILFPHWTRSDTRLEPNSMELQLCAVLTRDRGRWALKHLHGGWWTVTGCKNKIHWLSRAEPWPHRMLPHDASSNFYVNPVFSTGKSGAKVAGRRSDWPAGSDQNMIGCRRWKVDTVTRGLLAWALDPGGNHFC